MGAATGARPRSSCRSLLSSSAFESSAQSSAPYGMPPILGKRSDDKFDLSGMRRFETRPRQEFCERRNFNAWRSTSSSSQPRGSMEAFAVCKRWRRPLFSRVIRSSSRRFASPWRLRGCTRSRFEVSLLTWDGLVSMFSIFCRSMRFSSWISAARSSWSFLVFGLLLRWTCSFGALVSTMPRVPSSARRCLSWRLVSMRSATRRLHEA
mmetsp:Transcript_19195/g.57646  ORF Transcript_19195/g.57646 Transcript_19195/m.57646 type:complete len:208 (+) Transcript_19195:214-837(+)